jgi:3-hydroxyisobutyrate dehydrogenase-like beta-hydroxyacid dehydrogenase
MKQVGFAGLGRMGAPMATNLARAGFEVTVWNRTTEKANRLAEDIAVAVSATPRELAERSEIVITMLANDPASQRVHFGPDGLLAAPGGAEHIVEMGTHSPSHVRDLAAAAGSRW